MSKRQLLSKGALNQSLFRAEAAREEAKQLAAQAEASQQEHHMAVQACNLLQARQDAQGLPLRPDKQKVGELFALYDLDESGKIDSEQELMQLTTNLLVQLAMPVQVDQIEAAVQQQVAAIQQEGWAIEQFELWFWPTFEGMVGQSNAIIQAAAEELQVELGKLGVSLAAKMTKYESNIVNEGFQTDLLDRWSTRAEQHCKSK